MPFGRVRSKPEMEGSQELVSGVVAEVAAGGLGLGEVAVLEPGGEGRGDAPRQAQTQPVPVVVEAQRQPAGGVRPR